MLKGSASGHFPVEEFEKLPLLETRRAILSYLRYIRVVNEQRTYTSAGRNSPDVPEQLRKIFQRIILESPDVIHKEVLQMLASLKKILCYFLPIFSGSVSQEGDSNHKSTDLEPLLFVTLDKIRNHRNVVVSSMSPCNIPYDTNVKNEGSIAQVLYKDEEDILRILSDRSLRIRNMNGMLLTTYEIIADSLNMIVKNYNLMGLSHKPRNDIKSMVFRMTSLCSSITDIGDYLFLSWMLTANMRTEIPQCALNTKRLNIPYEGDVRSHIQHDTILTTFHKDNIKVSIIGCTMWAIYILAKMLKSIPCNCLKSVNKDPNFMFLSKKVSTSSIEVIKELKKVFSNEGDCQESEKRIRATHPLIFTTRTFVNNVLELISVIEILAFDRTVCPNVWSNFRRLKTVILETGRMLLWVNKESEESGCITAT